MSVEGLKKWLEDSRTSSHNSSNNENKEDVENGKLIKYEKMAFKLGIPIKYNFMHEGKNKFKERAIPKESF